MPAESKDSSIRNSTSKTTQVNPISLQPLEYFDAKKESFTYYIQHFENYLKRKNIFSNKQLLIPIGVTQYNVLSASMSPKISPELTFAELLKASKNTFVQRKMLSCCNINFFQHTRVEINNLRLYSYI